MPLPKRTPLSRGVYFLENLDEEGRAYLYAVDSDGVIIVPPTATEPENYDDTAEAMWVELEDRDPTQRVA